MALDCHFGTCYRHYIFNVAAERYTPKANELAEDKCMCQCVPPHEHFIPLWWAGSEMLICIAVRTCVLLIKQIPLAHIWRVINFRSGRSEISRLCHNDFSRRIDVKLSSNCEMSEGEFVTILNRKTAHIHTIKLTSSYSNLTSENKFLSPLNKTVEFFGVVCFGVFLHAK